MVRKLTGERVWTSSAQATIQPVSQHERHLYDPALDGEGPALEGAGATHAWVQVYLPGAGWIEFDPTNGLIGGTNLIRVGVARDPKQAIPLQGSYNGAAADFIDMTIEVTVSKLGERS